MAGISLRQTRSVLSQKQNKEQPGRGSSWWGHAWRTRFTSSHFSEHPALRGPGSLLSLQVPVCSRGKIQLFAAINSQKLIRGLGDRKLFSLVTSAHSLSNRFDNPALDGHPKKQYWNTEQVTAKALPVIAHCLSASNSALWPCLPQTFEHLSWVSKRRRFECITYAAKVPDCLVF